MSEQIPFQPMAPPRKHVSQERMWEILAKHASSQNQAGTAPSDAGLQAPTGRGNLPNNLPAKPIRWRKIGENTFESDKGPVMLVENGKYIVFDRRSENGHTAQPIGSFTQRQDALDFVRLL